MPVTRPNSDRVVSAALPNQRQSLGFRRFLDLVKLPFAGARLHSRRALEVAVPGQEPVGLPKRAIPPGLVVEEAVARVLGREEEQGKAQSPGLCQAVLAV